PRATSYLFPYTTLFRSVNIPEGLAPDELTAQKARELIEAPVAGDRVLGQNPANGKTIVVKDGRFGPYVQELEPVSEETADAGSADRKSTRLNSSHVKIS